MPSWPVKLRNVFNMKDEVNLSAHPCHYKIAKIMGKDVSNGILLYVMKAMFSVVMLIRMVIHLLSLWFKFRTTYRHETKFILSLQHNAVFPNGIYEVTTPRFVYGNFVSSRGKQPTMKGFLDRRTVSPMILSIPLDSKHGPRRATMPLCVNQYNLFDLVC